MTNNQPERGRLKDSAAMISAIAALITALVGLGAFFIGKGTSESPAAATTVTVVSTAGAAAGTTEPTGSVAAPKVLPEGVQLDEEVVFGQWNLDFVPPKQVASQNVQALAGRMLYVNGDHVLAEWTKPAQPGKAECADQVSATGFNQVDKLVKGSVVCGRTPEGRIFRLDVLSSGSEIRVHAVVWQK
ncbi:MULTISPECIES: hypothetical protein [unclassified Saccharothrix]|uniref:hypothetical protein n=1 Tax=unclassified Saccharothrix TaxID=2593673 RepID=UPI00307D3CA1